MSVPSGPMVFQAVDDGQTEILGTHLGASVMSLPDLVHICCFVLRIAIIAV